MPCQRRTMLVSELISIIIPIYNVEDYLERCIKSIQQQTYKNLEIILVNDGSTDGSTEVALEFCQMDPRIKLVNKENGGLSDARNVGIDVCKGKYIVFVDSDDYVEARYVELLYKSLVSNNAQMAVCSFNIVNDNGSVIKRKLVSEKKNEIITGREMLNRVMRADGYKYVVAWNKIYASNLLEDLRFEKGKLYEDEFFNFEVSYNLTKVSFVAEPLYNYVQRAGSIKLSELTNEKIEMQKEMHEKRISFYKDNKDKELYERAIQMYCNWMVNIVIEARGIINRDLLKSFKRSKKVFLLSMCTRQSSYGEKIQDCIAIFSLFVAAKIKKRRKEKIEND